MEAKRKYNMIYEVSRDTLLENKIYLAVCSENALITRKAERFVNAYNTLEFGELTNDQYCLYISKGIEPFLNLCSLYGVKESKIQAVRVAFKHLVSHEEDAEFYPGVKLRYLDIEIFERSARVQPQVAYDMLRIAEKDCVKYISSDEGVELVHAAEDEAERLNKINHELRYSGIAELTDLGKYSEFFQIADGKIEVDLLKVYNKLNG